MPRIRIESATRFDESTSRKLMDDVTDAVAVTLNLVADDRTVSFTSYGPGQFVMKPPYQLYIEIILFAGRTRAVKKQLYEAIVNTLHEKHGIERKTVMIQLNEQPRENWGLRGGIPADEIDFDYRIDI
jgi:phenylpyruvate tautomerase PptA (4-oxalocrotonate tautomerase family)